MSTFNHENSVARLLGMEIAATMAATLNGIFTSTKHDS
jgi:hypothetical protein